VKARITIVKKLIRTLVIRSLAIKCIFGSRKASIAIAIIVSHRRRDPPDPVQEADILSSSGSDLELCSYTALAVKLSDMKK
jgi:hypothetical protein